VTAQPLRLRIEIDPKGKPIQGQLSNEQGETIVFVGWLELIASLRKALNDSTSATQEVQRS
jgi:hypothetical protein